MPDGVLVLEKPKRMLTFGSGVFAVGWILPPTALALGRFRSPRGPSMDDRLTHPSGLSHLFVGCVTRLEYDQRRVQVNRRGTHQNPALEVA